MAKGKSGLGCGTTFFLAISIAIIFSFIDFINTESPTTHQNSEVSSSTPTIQIDKSSEMQAGRKKLIQDLIEKGIFQKIEVPGTLPRLWVRPGFYLLDYDTKQQFVSVVYAYCFEDESMGNIVRIYDSLSGKDVGGYTLLSGLKMK